MYSIYRIKNVGGSGDPNDGKEGYAQQLSADNIMTYLIMKVLIPLTGLSGAVTLNVGDVLVVYDDGTMVEEAPQSTVWYPNGRYQAV